MGDMQRKDGAGAQGSRGWRQATAGTYTDRVLPRGAALAFAIASLVIVLIPSVGMIWARTDATTENHALVELPSLTTDDGSFNEGYLNSLGEYFDQHFAYRNEAVTANAHLRALFGVSATDQVVVGTDGWLYYGGTLPDYLGQGLLSDQALSNIAHNLAIVQDYVESQGATFAFTIAPDKNALDSANMPYYYLRYDGASNAARLAPYLSSAGVNYVDLLTYFDDLMQQGQDFHYLKTDSHWDSYWALLAADELLEATGANALAPTYSDAVKRPGQQGDLQSMLYPTSAYCEDNYYFEGYNDGAGDTGSLWQYVEGSDVTDSFIRTEASGEGAGAADAAGAADVASASSESSASAQAESTSLLMFRDSFGNALLPYLGAAFDQAVFTKMVPYNITQMAQVQASCVIMERAQRHLSYLATDAPYMPSPRSTLQAVPEQAQQVALSANVEVSGAFWAVSGELPEQIDGAGTIYIAATLPDGSQAIFEPFLLSTQDEDGDIVNDRKFMVYIPQQSLDAPQVEFTVFSL